MRHSLRVFIAAAAVACCLGLVHAQGPRPSNSFQFRLGGFFPRGSGDFWQDTETIFTLDSSDLNGGIVGFTYATALSNNLEIGFNIDFYEEVATSQEIDYVDELGFPILHDTRLEIIPATVDLRFLPSGRYGVRGASGQRQVLQPVPYLGLGIGIDYWEYEEVGDFVVGPHPPLPGVPGVIVPARYIDTGTTFEAHVLAGVEFPVNPVFSFLLEGRYLWSEADLSGDFAGLGTLDLSGFAGYFGFAIHF